MRTMFEVFSTTKDRQALKIKSILFKSDMKLNSKFHLQPSGRHTQCAADQTTINAQINSTKSSHLDPEPDENELGSSWTLFTTPNAAECYFRLQMACMTFRTFRKLFHIYSAFKQSMKEFHCQMCKYWSESKKRMPFLRYYFCCFCCTPYAIRRTIKVQNEKKVFC